MEAEKEPSFCDRIGFIIWDLRIHRVGGGGPMSQQALADSALVSCGTVSRIERGYGCGSRTFEMLCKGLGTSPLYAINAAYRRAFVPVKDREKVK